MRRLGGVLGVEAMSLYRYVPGRENLLDAVVERIMDEMRDDPDVLEVPRDGWQDFLQRLAHGVRRMALAHPRAFPLVASRPPEAPWLRPPLRSLTWVEAFLDGLIAEGFRDDDGRRGLPRVHELPARPPAARGRHPRRGRRSARRPRRQRGHQRQEHRAYPTVHRLRSALAEDHAAAEFEEALEELLDRIALLRAEEP